MIKRLCSKNWQKIPASSATICNSASREDILTQVKQLSVLLLIFRTTGRATWQEQQFLLSYSGNLLFSYWKYTLLKEPIPSSKPQPLNCGFFSVLIFTVNSSYLYEIWFVCFNIKFFFYVYKVKIVLPSWRLEYFWTKVTQQIKEFQKFSFLIW